MLTAEPYRIVSGDSSLTHRFNYWDERSMNLRIDEIIDFKVGQNFEEVIEIYSKKCQSDNIDFSVVRVPSSDQKMIAHLHKNGFYNVETTYIAKCRVNKIQNINHSLGKTKSFDNTCDVNELCLLSSQIFNNGRFTEDYNIGKEKADKRYFNFASDLYHSDSDRIFMFSKDKLIGFLFFKKNENIINLILGGMSSKYSHLATIFWSKLFSSFDDNDIATATISGTNIGIMNLYSYFGFSFSDAKRGYHKKWK